MLVAGGWIRGRSQSHPVKPVARDLFAQVVGNQGRCPTGSNLVKVSQTFRFTFDGSAAGMGVPGNVAAGGALLPCACHVPVKPLVEPDFSVFEVRYRHDSGLTLNGSPRLSAAPAACPTNIVVTLTHTVDPLEQTFR